MRKPSQQLRKLIRSLSPQELKYVRHEISSNKELDSEQYLRMLDLIYQAAAPYDENMVRRKMKSGYFVTHFSQAKANLYALISGSLNRFYRQKDIALEFFDRLAWAELLSQRDMSSQLDEQLGGMKDMASRTGLLWMDFLVQQWQYKAAIQSGNPERLQQQLDDLAAQGAVRIRNLNIMHRLQEINLRMMHSYHNSGQMISAGFSQEIEKFYDELIDYEKLENITFEIRTLIAHSKFLYYWFKHDRLIVDQAAQHLELERSMTDLGKLNSLDLVKRLISQMGVNNRYWNYDLVESSFREIQLIAEREQAPWLQRRLMRAQLGYWNMWLSRGKIEDTIKSVEQASAPAFSEEDDAAFLAQWYIVKCFVYLTGMRYKQLKDLTLKIEQELSSELSDAHFVILKLSQLICAFKERDMVAFNSLYRSSVRFFERRGVYDESVKWFCAALNSGRKEGERARRQIWVEFCSKYNSHPKPKEMQLYTINAFVIWASAESRGISVEAWYQEYNV